MITESAQTTPIASRVDTLRVVCHDRIDLETWNTRVSELGGSFFHCHEHVSHEAAEASGRPVFLEVFCGNTLVGIAAGVVRTPRPPLLSHLCKEAWFNALPATRGGDALEEQAVLAACERAMRRMGIFRVKVDGCDSRNAAAVLSALGYQQSERFEFHLRLSSVVEQNWANLRSERRTKIRRATKESLSVRVGDGLEDVWTLINLSCEALQRKGMFAVAAGRSRDSMFQNLFKTGRTKVLICSNHEQPIGALLFGTFDGTACTLMAGSSGEGNRLGAMPLLYWELIRHLTEQHINTLNLGGVLLEPGQSPASNSLYAFKKDFGAEAVYQPSGLKTFRGPGSGLDAARAVVRKLLRERTKSGSAIRDRHGAPNK
jgi:hypothetical protein